MFGLVVAACLIVQATNITPTYDKCTLIKAPSTFDSAVLCEKYEKKFAIEFTKDKDLKITGHKCVDLSKITVTPVKPDATPSTPAPPEVNKVDPKLKPLTPEQKSQGAESL